MAFETIVQSTVIGPHSTSFFSSSCLPLVAFALFFLFLFLSLRAPSPPNGIPKSTQDAPTHLLTVDIGCYVCVCAYHLRTRLVSTQRDKPSLFLMDILPVWKDES